MQYLLSDITLVISQWLAKERPLTNGAQLGVVVMFLGVIVWLALACSDAYDISAAWWFATKTAGIVILAGIAIYVIAAIALVAKLRRERL